MQVVTVRTAKSKGSSMEYSTQYSLSKIHPDVYRTAERGFQRQFDLHIPSQDIAIECKRLKGVSWNQLLKFYKKLVSVSDCNTNYVVFKSNNQPALVLLEESGFYVIKTFESVFKTPFEKHPSTRVKKHEPTE